LSAKSQRNASNSIYTYIIRRIPLEFCRQFAELSLHFRTYARACTSDVREFARAGARAWDGGAAEHSAAPVGRSAPPIFFLETRVSLPCPQKPLVLLYGNAHIFVCVCVCVCAVCIMYLAYFLLYEHIRLLCYLLIIQTHSYINMCLYTLPNRSCV